MSNRRKAGETQKLRGARGRGFTRKDVRPGGVKLQVRCLTNRFEDARLASLASWREANEIFLWDRGGPYIVTQEGYAPDDLTMTPDEFVLGRSGKWLSLGIFFHMPVAERWQGFVFSTVAEALRLMRDLPPEPVTWHPASGIFGEIVSIETDPMATAYRDDKKRRAV